MIRARAVAKPTSLQKFAKNVAEFIECNREWMRASFVSYCQKRLPGGLMVLKCVALAAAMILSVLPASALIVEGQIASDTTWSKADNPIILQGRVQVRPGVKLTILPGAELRGNGQVLQVFGTLDATGSADERINFQNVTIHTGGYNGFVNLDYVRYSGVFFPATGGANAASFALTNSIVESTGDFTYVWYPERPVTIRGNVFFSPVNLSIGVNGIEVKIESNSFMSGLAIESWASYGGLKTFLNDNNFLGSTSVRLALGGMLDASGNYWNTTSDSKIRSMIHDTNDDAAIENSVKYKPYRVEYGSGPRAPRVVSSLPPSVDLYYDDTLSLGASFDGLPTPVLAWKRNGDTIVGEMRSSYEKRNVRSEDAGSYVATASNPYSIAETSTVVSIEKWPQSVSFYELTPTVYGGPTDSLSASASSGLPTSFTSMTLDVCSISGNGILLVGVGTCSIRADQVGNDRFAPAAGVERSFTVAKADTTTGISLSKLQLVPNDEFVVTATVSVLAPSTAKAEGIVTFFRDGIRIGEAIADSATGVASLTATAPTAGTYEITGRFEGSNLFGSSNSNTASITSTYRLEGEMRVNGRTVGPQTNPAGAALKDGRSVVVWESARTPQAKKAIIARIVDPEVTGDVEVAAADIGVEAPAVVGLPNGGFAVAWEAGRTGRKNVYLRIYSASAAPIGPAVRVSEIPGDHSAPALSAAGSVIAVAWEGQGPDGAGDGILARFFSTSGVSSGKTVIVNKTRAGDQRKPAVAFLGSSRIIIVWLGTSKAKMAVFGQVLTRAGKTSGPELVLERVPSVAITTLSLVGLTSGEFAAAWDQRTVPESPVRSYLSHFSKDGKRMRKLELDRSVAGDRSSPSIAVLHLGRLVATWGGLDGDDFGIRAQVIDGGSGANVLSAFAVNSDMQGNQSDSVVIPTGAAKARGKTFMVVWSSKHPDEQDEDIYLQRFVSP